MIQASRSARGVGVLRLALALHDAGSAGSKSPLEDEFLRLLRIARLPMPEVNAFVPTPGGRYRVDFVWRRRRLCIETDGRASHERRATKLEDELRDEHLEAAGFKVVRFTGRSVWGNPCGVAERVERLLR
jgi:very-short-patch-repair endonuclease